MFRRMLILLFLIPFILTHADLGELIINTIPAGRTFNVELNTGDLSWNYVNNQLVLDSRIYPQIYSNRVSLTFDAPKSQDGGSGTEELAWGNFTFRFIFGGYDITVGIDFTDESWATNRESYSGPDTKIYLNMSNGDITLQANRIVYTLSPNAQYAIWDLWNAKEPEQSNFIVPVAFYNRVENTPANIGGYLISNGAQVNSGNTINFKIVSNKTVQEGTKEYTDTQRKYAFSWATQGISILNSSIYNSQISYDFADFSRNSKEIVRNFRNVYPLTVKNILPELGTQSYGTIMFKDPTTTNAFEEKTATGSGFVKNEAFASFDETVSARLRV